MQTADIQRRAKRAGNTVAILAIFSLFFSTHMACGSQKKGRSSDGRLLKRCAFQVRHGKKKKVEKRLLDLVTSYTHKSLGTLALTNHTAMMDEASSRHQLFVLLLFSLVFYSLKVKKFLNLAGNK